MSILNDVCQEFKKTKRSAFCEKCHYSELLHKIAHKIKSKISVKNPQ